MKYRFLWIVAAFAASCYPTAAFGLDATTKVRARDLVNRGVADFERGEFEVARGQFMEAYALAEAPTVAVWAARAHEKLGRLIEASHLYRRALTMQRNDLWSGQTQQHAQQAATEALVALEERIPRLTIGFVGERHPDAEVLLDGTKVSVGDPGLGHRVDPGAHRIEVRRGTRIVAERSVTLAEGETQTVQLAVAAEPVLSPYTVVKLHSVRFAPAPGAKERDHALPRNLTWVSLGIGAAGVAVGTVAGIVTAVKHGDLQADGCVDSTCRGSRFNDPVDGYNIWRTVSTTGFVVGAIGAAAGVTLWLAVPKGETPPRVGLSINPGSLSMAGEF